MNERPVMSSGKFVLSAIFPLTESFTEYDELLINSVGWRPAHSGTGPEGRTLVWEFRHNWQRILARQSIERLRHPTIRTISEGAE